MRNRYLIGASIITPSGEQWIARRECNIFEVRLSEDQCWLEWQLYGEPYRWQAVPIERVKYIIYNERVNV